jgi:uncharacterized membrane protein
LYTRRTWGVFIFAILAMACKEEIPLLVACVGIWSLVFQLRWRTGLALTLLASIWAVMSLLVIPHLYSPTGHALLAARYADLGATPLDVARNLILHPVSVLKEDVFEPVRLFYLRALFMPAGLLPLVAPWILILALPSLAINLLSSNGQMHSGFAFYHYDAEIVPIVIFATIETIVLLIILGQRLLAFVSQKEGQKFQSRLSSLPAPAVRVGLLVLLSTYLLTLVIHYNMLQGPLPISKEFQWPAITAHTTLAQHFIAEIPPTASLSAQSALVPHVSHRAQIYLFPYGDGVTTPVYADYIFLDVTSDPYPFFGTNAYNSEVEKVLQSGVYGIVEQRDGYMLLKRGLPAPNSLPSFISS